MSADATQEEYEEVQAEIKKKEDEVSGSHITIHFLDSMCVSRGGDRGVRTPPEKSQKYRISYKVTKPVFNDGPTSAKRHLNGVLLTGR